MPNFVIYLEKINGGRGRLKYTFVEDDNAHRRQVGEQNSLVNVYFVEVIQEVISEGEL